MSIETKIEELRKEFNSKLDEILKAEIVKPKTIDEIADEITNELTTKIFMSSEDIKTDIINYAKENKQDIINALNNL